MTGRSPILGADRTVATGSPPALQLPAAIVELTEVRCVSIDRKLGYFRDERFVIFGYCPAGAEVVWKDGHSLGFGTGGWWTFLEEIAPMAARRGYGLGSATTAGTHVLLVDRTRGTVYVAEREPAEGFLSRVHGQPGPTRRCLCALTNCAACPVR